jgi:hypothetical protein
MRHTLRIAHIVYSANLLSFAGVFANFHEQLAKASVVLYPATPLTGIISAISFKSSLESFTLKEPILLSRFLILVVPTKP